jgi:hypothetical protein
VWRRRQELLDRAQRNVTIWHRLWAASLAIGSVCQGMFPQKHDPILVQDQAHAHGNWPQQGGDPRSCTMLTCVYCDPPDLILGLQRAAAVELWQCGQLAAVRELSTLPTVTLADHVTMSCRTRSKYAKGAR